MKKFSLHPRAFTLIELLIVITIIGILAAALLPRITSGPEKARDAQRKADLQQISTALEFYADDNAGLYPIAVAGNCVSALNLSDYLTSTPDDPQGKNSDGAGFTGCVSGYTYQPLDAASSYVLVAALESPTANGEGHYNLTDFTVITPASTPYSDQLTANSTDLCAPFGASDCTTDGVAYLTGR